MVYKKFVVCNYHNNDYLVGKIGNNWCYCEAYISQCVGDDKKKLEEEEKKQDEHTKR